MYSTAEMTFKKINAELATHRPRARRRQRHFFPMPAQSAVNFIFIDGINQIKIDH